MTCSIPDCGKPVHARSLCHMHYVRQRRTGDPNAVRRIAKYETDAQCSVPSCEGSPKSSGLCEKHYIRFRKYGDPEFVLVDQGPATERWKNLYEVVNLGYDTPCWLWTGKVEQQGYGRIKDRRKVTGVVDALAHRFVYQQVVGPIPDGFLLDHLCHNNDPLCASGIECRHRRCVNPDHLEPVLSIVNTLRGRTPAAANFSKQVCIRGHEYTEENTRINPDMSRSCLACGRIRQAEFRARRRAQRKALGQ